MSHELDFEYRGVKVSYFAPEGDWRVYPPDIDPTYERDEDDEGLICVTPAEARRYIDLLFAGKETHDRLKLPTHPDRAADIRGTIKRLGELTAGDPSTWDRQAIYDLVYGLKIAVEYAHTGRGGRYRRGRVPSEAHESP